MTHTRTPAIAGAVALSLALGLAPLSPASAADTSDTQSPSRVAGLTAVATSATSIDVAWTASTDDVGVTGYSISTRAAGTPALTVDGSTTTATLAGLRPGERYVVSVRVRDAAGNVNYSDAVDVRTPVADADLLLPDLEAPSPVRAFTASARTAESADVVWYRSLDNVAVTEYRIWDRRSQRVIATTDARVGASGIRRLTVPLAPSTSYELVMFAVDAAGNQSPASPVRAVTTPAR